jgi:hypothetical protein
MIWPERASRASFMRSDREMASTAPSSTIANHDMTTPLPKPVGEPVSALEVHGNAEEEDDHE